MPDTKRVVTSLTYRRWMRTYRAKKQAQGLCIWGGCNESVPGYYCPTHREYAVAMNLKQRVARAAAGLCITHECTTRPSNGYKTCEKCLQKDRDRLRLQRLRRKEKKP